MLRYNCVAGKELIQARQKQNCIGLPYWYKSPSGNVSVYAEARESGGMLPEEIFFFEFDVVRWLLRLFFWVQNITTIPCFSPGLVTGF